jgi:GNAT superfamily N-acetyltransferase
MIRPYLREIYIPLPVNYCIGFSYVKFRNLPVIKGILKWFFRGIGFVLVQIAASDTQISGCFAVMAQLRPHLKSDEFVDRIRRQMQAGYQLAFLAANQLETNQLETNQLETNQRAIAVAGFRLSESLSWGKFLYVDDLVVVQEERSQGYGQQLLHWLIDYAQQQNCQQFHLDSGVQRFAAHRFYFQQRLSIIGYHFALTL